MRAIWLALALGACGSSAAPRPAPVANVAEAEGLRLPRTAPAVGDRRTLTSSMRMDADTTLPDGSARHILVEETVTEEIEVLEVSGGSEQKVRVTYPSARLTRNMGDIKSKEDKPIAGHTYVVWLEGGKVHATREDGATLRAAEEQELVDEWDDDLGHVDPILEILVSEAWTLGARRDLSAAERARVHFGDDDVEVTSGSIALAATAADTATFELDVVMRGRDEDSEMEMPGRVELVIERRTGRLTSMTVKGAIRGRTGDMQIAGEIDVEQRWTYP